LESWGREVDFGERYEFSFALNGNPRNIAAPAFWTIGSRWKVERAAFFASCCHDLVLLEIGYQWRDLCLGDVAEASEFLETQEYYALRIETAEYMPIPPMFWANPIFAPSTCMSPASLLS